MILGDRLSDGIVWKIERNVMIGTQILQGQGLGNRLFCYVTARSIAEQKKTSFGVPGKEILLNGLTGFRALSGSLDGRRSKTGRFYTRL